MTSTRRRRALLPFLRLLHYQSRAAGGVGAERGFFFLRVAFCFSFGTAVVQKLDGTWKGTPTLLPLSAEFVTPRWTKCVLFLEAPEALAGLWPS